MVQKTAVSWGVRELFRGFIHVLIIGGVPIALLYMPFLEDWHIWALLLIGSAAAVIYDVIRRRRLRSAAPGEESWLFRYGHREDERHKPWTGVYMIAGFIFALALSPERWIVLFVCIFAGFVDPFAKFGKYVPVIRIGKKSLGGSCIGFAAGLLVLFLLLETNIPIIPDALPRESIFDLGVVGCAAVTMAEFADQWRLDNLLMLIAGSVAMTIGFYIL